MGKAKLPQTTIARLPIYLRSLVMLASRGERIVSSDGLAQIAGTNAAQLRKDLSYLGEFGIRGVGYEIDQLINEVSKWLGLLKNRKVVIVGLGRLGGALAGYQGFSEKGFKIVGAFDRDPALVGIEVGGLTIQHIDELDDFVKSVSGGIDIGIIATQAPSAQGVADRMVNAGIKAIINFAPITIDIPNGVVLRQVDLSVELQILSYYLQKV
ncbi:MAG: redox-sensing transcriptional repressor Rex [Actinobacteria bacterium]|nr:redox-sensing transcriptional repressor Rex [Actinomycetota bacterium]